MKLDQVKAIVTGASRGIGLEVAKQLAARGGKVVMTARSKDALEAAAAEIGAVAVTADVAVEQDAVRAVREAVDALGSVNVLINNAGFGRFSPLVDQDLESFEAILRTNVLGAMLMARECSRHFVQQNTGNIINVASTASFKGFAGGTAYAASKFALAGMTECWRAELRQHNVRVMQVNPSEVLTNFAATAGFEQSASERKLHAEDIAHAILSMLEMHDRGFVTDLTVFATNPP